MAKTENRDPIKIVYRVARFLLRIYYRLYFRWEVYNADRVPLSGGLLIVANHASLLDPPMVGSASERGLHFMARDTLFRFWGFGWLLRQVQSHPLKRENSRSALRTAGEMLKKGWAVVVFPEGTRTHDGNLQPAKAGVGFLALDAKVPVIPVHLEGTYRAQSRHMRFPRPAKIVIRWGHPLTVEELIERGGTDKKPAQAIADAVMQEIASLGGHAISGEEDGPPAPTQGPGEE